MKKIKKTTKAKLIVSLLASVSISSLVAVSAVACSSNDVNLSPNDTINQIPKSKPDLKDQISVSPIKQIYEFANNSNGVIGVKPNNLSDGKSIMYQWYFSQTKSNNINETNLLSGATAPTLKIPEWIKNNPLIKVDGSLTYYFFVAWKTNNQSGVSKTIQVKITNNATQPTIVLNGQKTYLNAKVNIALTNPDKLGWTPKNYQWQVYVGNSWVSMADQQKSILDISLDQLGIFQYQLVLSNETNYFITNMVSVDVQNWANILISSNIAMQNNIITTDFGTSIKLESSLMDSGFNDPYYQWQTSDENNQWINIANANQTSYQFIASSPGFPTKYRLIVMNGQNSFQSTTSEAIFVDVPSKLGTISLAYKNSALNNNVFNIPLNKSITLIPTFKNSNVLQEKNKLQFQWQQKTSQGWKDIADANQEQYVFSTNAYIQKIIRLKVSLLNNWIGGTAYSNALTLQVPISKQQVQDLKTKLSDWINNQQNQINLMQNWVNNAGLEYTISLMSQWMQNYRLENLSLQNWTTNISPFKISITSNGLITASTTTLTNSLSLGIWSSKDVVKVPKNTTITVLLPYSFNDVYNDGNKLTFLDSQINDSGGISLVFNNNIFSSYYNAFNTNILKNLNWPYGMQFIYKDQSLIPNTFFYGLNKQGWKDNTQTIPFNLWSSNGLQNNEIILNSQNSILPDFINKGAPTIIWNANTSNPLNLVKDGNSGTISIAPELSTSQVAFYTYQWYVAKNDTNKVWKKLTTNADSNSLNIIVPSDLKENQSWLYRCEISYFYNGKTVIVNSPDFTVNFSTGSTISAYSLFNINNSYLNYYLQWKKD